MKKYQLLFIALVGFIVTSCNCPECSEHTSATCTTDFGLIDPATCPTGCPPCSGSATETLKTPLTEADATTWINNYKATMSSQVSYGTLVDKCQMCLVAREAVQDLSIFIGKKTSGATTTDFIIIAKYKTVDGTVKWADVTDPESTGGPICPGGSKCS